MASKKIYLYLIERPDNEDIWDQYTGAIVAAINEHSARLIHPKGDGNPWDALQSKWLPNPQHAWANDSWPVKPEEVKVTLIGIAVKGIEANSVVFSNFQSS